VYLCRGIAHGFYVRKSPATVVYHVTSEHDPAHDTGILWSSFDAPWPVNNPIVSARDQSLPTFSAFESPFRMDSMNSKTKGAH
jgi:dTDP-4-dehydrorhamnose 3,5-epimerase